MLLDIIKGRWDVWCNAHPWLLLNSEEKAICKICTEAIERKLITSLQGCEQQSKAAWVDEGFSKWSNGLERIKRHEVSSLHIVAAKAIINSKKTSIVEKVSTGHQLQMSQSRVALLKIFSTIRLLGQQGLPLRGDGSDENSNFIRFLTLRSEDVPELKRWLSSDSKKWLSHDIQNEILSRLSKPLLEKILLKVRQSKFFSITLDETPDCASLEQLSICVRVVSSNLDSSEYFLGLYNINSTSAESLLDVVKDVFIRLQLDFSKLRGQCYDGAANMSGRHNGLQARILKIEPRALFVHCNAHNLNLVVQDAITTVEWTRDNIGVAKDLIKFIRDSPKRLYEFKELGGRSPKAYNPTRYNI